MNSKRVVIIGGGIVGLATAYRLTERFPDARVCVLEKEAGVGRHQTGHNSGVLHCGLYYKPGSVKARLAVRGIRQMVEFCQEHAIPHEICGKLVVAADRRGTAAAARPARARHRQTAWKASAWLTRAEMREIEPHVGGVAALRVPQEGIVDYRKVCEALVCQAIHRGGGHRRARRKRCARRRSGLDRLHHRRRIRGRSPDQLRRAALRPRRRDGRASAATVRILPFRGEYYKIKPDAPVLVRHLIYPVPDPQFPFLGVHFTRLIHGGIEAGPNAVLAFAREGYRKTDVNVRDLYDRSPMAASGISWAAIARMCWDELRRSFSRRLFCRIPAAPGAGDSARRSRNRRRGVRAQAITPEGELVQDFR